MLRVPKEMPGRARRPCADRTTGVGAPMLHPPRGLRTFASCCLQRQELLDEGRVAPRS